MALPGAQPGPAPSPRGWGPPSTEGAASPSSWTPHSRKIRGAAAWTPYLGGAPAPRPAVCAGPSALRRPPRRRGPGTGRSFEAAA